MGRIPRTDGNVVPIPRNVSVSPKGYVYLNLSTWWGEKAGGGKCARHEKACVGMAVNPSDWRSDRRMWANARYRELFPGEAPLPSAPATSDCVSVGLRAAIDAVCGSTGLRGCLDGAFGPDAADVLLDLAYYMLSAESAVMQHYPHWRRCHAGRDGVPTSDSAVSRFLATAAGPEAVTRFRRLWAAEAIGDGRVFLCYDSTNVNSRASGVWIVQRGHAKDDPELDQVNTEYVVRQSDGLPVTFAEYPGSVNDVAEAKEVISFLEELLGADSDVDATVVTDRGYVSEANLRGMLDAGLGFLVLLRRNLGVAVDALGALAPKVRRSENRIPGRDAYAASARMRILSDGTEAWLHVVWDADLEPRHRKALYDRVDAQERALRKAVERGERMTSGELDSYRRHFSLVTREEGTLKVNKRGRGAGGTRDVAAHVVVSFGRDHDKITAEDGRCGYYVLASSSEMSGAEAVEAYARRDCVEKVFLTLKSHLGMDKYGVQTEAAMHSKALAWFCASVVYTTIFTSTSELRKRDAKRYTVPACIRQLEELEATRDPRTGAYSRRYQPTRTQKNVLAALGVGLADVDAIASGIASGAPEAPTDATDATTDSAGIS